MSFSLYSENPKSSGAPHVAPLLIVRRPGAPVSLQPAYRSIRAGTPSRDPSRLACAPPASSRRRSRWWTFPALFGVAAFGAVCALLYGQPETPKAVVPRTVIAPTILRAANQGAVRWHQEAVDVVLDSSLDAISASAASSFGRALDAWRASDASLPSVSTSRDDAATKSRQIGYDASGPNQNVLMYAKYGWAPAHGALAVTVLTYDKATGKILDADIVFNGGGRLFGELTTESSEGIGDPVVIEPAIQNGTSAETDEDSDVDTQESKLTESASALSSSSPAAQQSGSRKYDFANILTHELGHFLGLSEDYQNERSTMYTTTRLGETTKRVIEADDATALQVVYSGEFADSSGIRGCGAAQIAPAPAGASGGQRGGVAGVVGLGMAFLGLRRIRKSAKGHSLLRMSSALKPFDRTPYERPGAIRGQHQAVGEDR